MSDFDEIATAVLELSENEREAIAALALGSLPLSKPQADEIEAAWEKEIQQRIADVDAGLEAGISWQEVKMQTRMKYLQ